jgi:hypothetical protein
MQQKPARLQVRQEGLAQALALQRVQEMDSQAL